MSRLEKFIEMRDGGERRRTAYALGAERLPAPVAGARWHLVSDFNASDELLVNAGLEGVYRVAIADGFAVLPAGTE